jgi:signal transduction histidine kinase/ActR/RegA family two-component response regulator
MSPALRLQRLEALAALVASFTRADDGYLDDALDALVEATAARAAVAFGADGGPRAERRLGDPLKVASSGLGDTLRRIADVALNEGRQHEMRDTGARDGDFSALGGAVAFAVPLSISHAERFAVVLLFDDPAMLDEETRSFIDTVVGLTVLALDRHRARSLIPRSSGPVETSRGPELDLYSKSIGQELLGPAGALVVQLEELRQINERMAGLIDPHDADLAADVADLGDVAAEMGAVAERLRETVAGLMTASTEASAPAELDLSEIAHEALALTKEQLERRGIRLSERIEAGSFVFGRRGSLARVVQSLVTYAASAAADATMPEITLRVSGNGQSVVLEVESNCAVTADTALAELSKPASNARRAGGVGLRLAIDVVAAHGGHVEVAARPSGGSTLRVVLPAAKAEPPAAPPLVPSIAPALLSSAERRRILIVDDEPMFSRSIRRALRPHEVRIAGTASEAELVLFDPAYEPDLVVCDVFLPGTNGNLLHERVRKIRPALAARFVFVTGGALGKPEADYLRASGCATLFKPFDVGALLGLIARGDPEPAVRTLSPSEPPNGSAR